MGDGWETKRRRGPGNDWSVVRLAARGVMHRVEIDTDHFKGNAPGSAMVETLDAGSTKGLDEPQGHWETLLPRTELQPHTRHRFDRLANAKPATHARLSIFPDGGIARLRLYGTPA
jgi:allantoicase